MEAKEWRLGNLIYRNGNLSEIKYYDFEHFVKKDDPRHYIEWNCIKPIPLTEEWLINLGFVKVLDYPCFRLDGLQIEFNGFESQWESGLLDEKTVINYVHQLQNLFFALKGKDLIIKN